MNNQIKDLKLQTFGGKESEVALGCEKSHRSKRVKRGARGLMKGGRAAVLFCVPVHLVQHLIIFHNDHISHLFPGF